MSHRIGPGTFLGHYNRGFDNVDGYTWAENKTDAMDAPLRTEFDDTNDYIAASHSNTVISPRTMQKLRGGLSIYRRTITNHLHAAGKPVNL